MVRTGYYKRIDEYRQAGFEIVSISRSEPEWATVDRKIWELAPSRETLNNFKYNGGSEEQYTREYLQQLEKLGYSRVVKMIADSGRKVILMCWESDGVFCHRHLLADWLNQKVGREIVVEY